MIFYAIHCRSVDQMSLGRYTEDLISNPDTFWIDYNDKHKMGFHMCRIWMIPELNEASQYCFSMDRLCNGKHEVIEIVEPV